MLRSITITPSHTLTTKYRQRIWVISGWYFTSIISDIRHFLRYIWPSINSGLTFPGGFKIPKAKIPRSLCDRYISLYGNCVIFLVIYVQLLKFNAQIWSWRNQILCLLAKVQLEWKMTSGTSKKRRIDWSVKLEQEILSKARSAAPQCQ